MSMNCTFLVGTQYNDNVYILLRRNPISIQRKPHRFIFKVQERLETYKYNQNKNNLWRSLLHYIHAPLMQLLINISKTLHF